MAKTLSVEEAEARANQLQQERLSAIRGLAEARQNVVDVRADADRRRAELERELAASVSDAERDDVLRYNAALSAGWTDAELRKIGFDEPDKKQRTRKRAARKQTSSQSAPASANGSEGGGSDLV
ncbi:hypothetical protein ABTZ44_19960 [Microbacterium oxydans]|uniref:hypothetical protein n=1 Tax=Microbacterium TaxID=33882 RepID=UPI00062901D9|nr:MULTISPECIES: hypothetical protein [Microbacterium]KKX99549.1 hypothetical protein AAY78_01465 [Microbacterium sp. Ag1]MCT2087474.1 hypothetical protein [Microbacterium enclense]NYF30385.1 hypothetical protein [Microbacterium sp. JAI119]PZT92072.1 MAG: hypothetical protein DI630_28825 [Gordonia sp. (in: high G+C Gram-positive bacteria)]